MQLANPQSDCGEFNLCDFLLFVLERVHRACFNIYRYACMLIRYIKGLRNKKKAMKSCPLPRKIVMPKDELHEVSCSRRLTPANTLKSSNGGQIL